MADAAVKMSAELGELVGGKIPKTSVYKREVSLAERWPASRNKVWTCNAAALLAALWGHAQAKVSQLLTWFAWATLQPLEDGEEYVGEEVYRLTPIQGAMVGAAVAHRTGDTVTRDSCRRYTRANFTLLLLGAGAGPGRRITDWRPLPGGGVHLVGNGDPISKNNMIVTAGQRTLIRNRHDGPAIFQFVHGEGLSAAVAQAFGIAVSKPGPVRRQVDLFKAIQELAPDVDLFGFSAEDRAVAKAFLANPADHMLARQLVAWIEPQPLPDYDFDMVRYVDGSFVMVIWQGHLSSTDELPIKSWRADGVIEIVSADDGDRDESPGQVVVEFADRFACQMFHAGDPKDTFGPIVEWRKPLDAHGAPIAEAYRVQSRDAKIAVVVHGIEAPTPPPQPGSKPAPQRPRPKRFWEFWK